MIVTNAIFKSPVLVAVIEDSELIDLGVEAVYIRGEDKTGRIIEVLRSALKKEPDTIRVGYVVEEDIEIYAKSKDVGPGELYLSPSLEEHRPIIERCLFWGIPFPSGI